MEGNLGTWQIDIFIKKKNILDRNGKYYDEAEFRLRLLISLKKIIGMHKCICIDMCFLAQLRGRLYCYFLHRGFYFSFDFYVLLPDVCTYVYSRCIVCLSITVTICQIQCFQRSLHFDKFMIFIYHRDETTTKF